MVHLQLGRAQETDGGKKEGRKLRLKSSEQRQIQGNQDMKNASAIIHKMAAEISTLRITVKSRHNTVETQNCTALLRYNRLFVRITWFTWLSRRERGEISWKKERTLPENSEFCPPSDATHAHRTTQSPHHAHWSRSRLGRPLQVRTNFFVTSTTCKFPATSDEKKYANRSLVAKNSKSGNTQLAHAHMQSGSPPKKLSQAKLVFK